MTPALAAASEAWFTSARAHNLGPGDRWTPVGYRRPDAKRDTWHVWGEESRVWHGLTHHKSPCILYLIPFGWWFVISNIHGHIAYRCLYIHIYICIYIYIHVMVPQNKLVDRFPYYGYHRHNSLCKPIDQGISHTSLERLRCHWPSTICE